LKLAIYILEISLGNIGKLLIFGGLILIILGFILTVMPNIPWIGRLPGDIIIKKKNFQFYFPIVTCIIISLILTLLFNLFRR
jgi:hypothetical protein